MQIYPFSAPIILTDAIYLAYGGRTGTFSAAQLQSSYWLAEMQVSKHIGTLLLPTIVTGTFPYTGQKRIATDYGYVSNILDVNILSVNGFSISCDLISNKGCVFIYEDTFGYLDVRQVLTSSNLGYPAVYPLAYPIFPLFNPYTFTNPYQFQITYQAGLPTGTANMPGILEALVILAQMDLNEKDPGNAGMNEGVGTVGITEFADVGTRGYREVRKQGDLKRTIFGSSPKANYAARLIDATIRKARPLLRM